MNCSYESYAEAHKELGIPGDPKYDINVSGEGGLVTSLKITDAPEMYHEIKHGGRFIYYVGFGRMRSPGHPASTQQYYRQNAFLNSIQAVNIIPVLHAVGRNKRVHLLGNYVAKDIYKRVSNEGFAYFLVRLQKIPVSAADLPL